MGRALVLNASESPLAVVRRGRCVMVLKEKADVVLTNGMVFHSAQLTVERTSVVRLRRYVHVPYRPHAGSRGGPCSPVTSAPVDTAARPRRTWTT